MNSIDSEVLGRINDDLKLRIRRYELWRQNAPLREAMSKQIIFLQKSLTPALMQGPQKRVEESVTNMEATLKKFPQQLAEAKAKYDGLLESARTRTAALEDWLQSL